MKKADWADHLADSATPSDDFTWSDGSNFGLDGFQFDQTMNEGVLDGARLPTVHGLSELPDGLFGGSDEPMEIDGQDYETGNIDLSAMLSEEEGARPMTARQREAAALADLNWLDPTVDQDPARLPKERRPGSGSTNVIPELEEAWGVERRTDGLRLLPNRDLEVAQYEESIAGQKPALPGVEGRTAQLTADALRRALRRATYGDPLADIKAELHQTLGLDSPRALRACQAVEADYGLAGTVFLRANAFPGLKNGQWTRMLKRVARTARYIITEDSSLGPKMGLRAVREIDWAKAAAHYLPKLRMAGYKVASAPDPKERLRQAFLRGPEKRKAAEEHKPVEVQAADTITVLEAQRQFQAAEKPERQVVTVDHTAANRKVVLAKVARYVQANLLTRKDALRLGESQAHPDAIAKAAALLVQAGRQVQGTYDGTGTQVARPVEASREEAWKVLAGAEKQATVEARKLEAANVEKAKTSIARMAKAGSLTKKEALYAVQNGKTAAEMMSLATTIVQQAGESRKPNMRAVEAREFTGPVFDRAQHSTPEVRPLPVHERSMLAAARTSGIKLAEFRHLATWLRQAMSDGLMGADLDNVIRLRFASPLRKAAKDMVRQLRAEHEGLSGVFYVDAEAYSSKAGCEAGAQKHRANQVQYVMAMDRCDSCSFKNAHTTCTKYNKPLIVGLPKSARAMQASNIKSADAPDYENTAALFNPGEFNLTNSLDSIELDNFADNETLGEVFFGGMEV